MMVGFRSKNHLQQVAKRAHKEAQLFEGYESPITDDDTDDRAYPPEDFAVLNARFHFTLDVAASDDNAKVPRYYTAATNGLIHPWTDERVYLNPPYSSITPWLVKAWAETGAKVIVALLPANRTEQGWWQTHIEPFRDRRGSPLTVEFLPHRRRFLKKGQLKIGANERPPFGLCLCIWKH